MSGHMLVLYFGDVSTKTPVRHSAQDLGSVPTCTAVVTHQQYKQESQGPRRSRVLHHFTTMSVASLIEGSLCFSSYPLTDLPPRAWGRSVKSKSPYIPTSLPSS